MKAKEAAHAKALADFYALTGMKLGPTNPIPQEKIPASIDYLSPATAPERESPAADATAPEGFRIGRRSYTTSDISGCTEIALGNATTFSTPLSSAVNTCSGSPTR